MKFYKNQGFSLLEVMIALGVVSFLSFTVLQLVFTNLQATKSVEITAALDNLIMEVNMALKDPTICQSNITNFSTTSLPSPLEGASINFKQITLPSVTNPLVSSNASLVNLPGTKLSLNIDSIKPISAVTYLANISISLDKGQGVIGGRNIVRRLPISLTLTTAGGPITGCNTFGPSGGSAAMTAPTICALVGQTFDPVTNKCSGAVASGGPGCQAASTTCGGKSVPVPALSDGGDYKKEWQNIDNFIGARCVLEISCKKSGWSEVSCYCV